MKIQALQTRLTGYDKQQKDVGRTRLVAMARRFATADHISDKAIVELDAGLTEAGMTRLDFLGWVAAIQQMAGLKARVEEGERTNPREAYDVARRRLDGVLVEEGKIPVAETTQMAEWRARRSQAMAEVDRTFSKLQDHNAATKQMGDLEFKYPQLKGEG